MVRFKSPWEFFGSTGNIHFLVDHLLRSGLIFWLDISTEPDIELNIAFSPTLRSLPLTTTVKLTFLFKKATKKALPKNFFKKSSRPMARSCLEIFLTELYLLSITLKIG
jgi:hypothetical protein